MMLRLITIMLVMLTAHSQASAGWLTIKNETKSTIILEEVTEGPIVKRGKTIRLLPGEVYREFSINPGEKKVHIYESAARNQPVCKGCLVWKTGDVTMTVETKTVLQKLEWAMKELLPTKTEVPAKKP